MLKKSAKTWCFLSCNAKYKLIKILHYQTEFEGTRKLSLFDVIEKLQETIDIVHDSLFIHC